MAATRAVLVNNETRLVEDGAAIVAGDGYTAPDGFTLVPSNVAGPGWSYDGSSLSPPAPAAATQADLLRYASEKQDSVLSKVWSFSVEGLSIALTTKLDSRGAASMAKLLLWAMANADASATEAYVNDDLVTTADLSIAQAKSLALQAGAIESQSYAVLKSLSAAIMATPPTITTLDQINAAAWPTPAS